MLYQNYEYIIILYIYVILYTVLYDLLTLYVAYIILYLCFGNVSEPPHLVRTSAGTGAAGPGKSRCQSSTSRPTWGLTSPGRLPRQSGKKNTPSLKPDDQAKPVASLLHMMELAKPCLLCIRGGLHVTFDVNDLWCRSRVTSMGKSVKRWVTATSPFVELCTPTAMLRRKKPSSGSPPWCAPSEVLEKWAA